MISSMLKLLMSVTLLSSVLWAQSDVTTEQAVIAYLKKSIASNETYAFESASVLKKESMKEMPQWSVYFMKIDLTLRNQAGQKVSIYDVVFSNGELLSRDFVALQNQRSIKGTYSIDVDASLYTKDHLIAGRMDALHKLVIFSDPLCPFCMDLVPEVIEDVEKHPETFALFYYHFPLRIHPASTTLIKAMLVAEEQGDKEIIKKVYQAFLDTKESDEKIVLNLFNQTFQTTITTADIHQEHIVKKLLFDQETANRLMINGTPMIYIDGKKDDTKRSYKTYIKEKK